MIFFVKFFLFNKQSYGSTNAFNKTVSGFLLFVSGVRGIKHWRIKEFWQEVSAFRYQWSPLCVPEPDVINSHCTNCVTETFKNQDNFIRKPLVAQKKIFPCHI